MKKSLEVTLQLLETQELSTVSPEVDSCGTVSYPGGSADLDNQMPASCCCCCCA